MPSSQRGLSDHSTHSALILCQRYSLLCYSLFLQSLWQILSLSGLKFYSLSAPSPTRSMLVEDRNCVCLIPCLCSCGTVMGMWGSLRKGQEVLIKNGSQSMDAFFPCKFATYMSGSCLAELCASAGWVSCTVYYGVKNMCSGTILLSENDCVTLAKLLNLSESYFAHL